MSFALRQQSPRTYETVRTPSVCRVHTCLRCKTSISSSEPCSFVFAMYRVCGPCAGQQQVAARIPAPRTPWAAALARTRRD